MINLFFAILFLFSFQVWSGEKISKKGINESLPILLKRLRPNEKYRIRKLIKGEKSSPYDRLMMKNKPSFDEFGAELNIYKEIQTRKKGH